MMDRVYKKGDIVFVLNDDIFVPGVQSGSRPYIVVSNDKFNLHSPVLNCIPLTTRCKKSPVHYFLHKNIGISQDSYALCEQVQTISKNNVGDVICSLPSNIVLQINKLLSFQFSL